MATIPRFLLAILMVANALHLSTCSQKEETGPGEVRWDRMVCERCRMALSDHYYSAQVRGGVEEKRTKLYYFDDLGCAVIWLDKQTWKASSRTEVWVNDHLSGEWLNADSASYVKGKITPMDFGLGAIPDHMENTLNYTQAVQHIFARSNRTLKHNADPASSNKGKDK